MFNILIALTKRQVGSATSKLYIRIRERNIYSVDAVYKISMPFRLYFTPGSAPQELYFNFHIMIGLHFTAILPDGKQCCGLLWSTLTQKISVHSRLEHIDFRFQTFQIIFYLDKDKGLIEMPLHEIFAIRNCKASKFKYIIGNRSAIRLLFRHQHRLSKLGFPSRTRTRRFY